MNELLTRVTRASLRYPWRFLMAALALSAASVWLASGLEVRSSFEELLPSDLPAVKNLKELMRRVGGDGTILISLESLDGPQGLSAAKVLAPKLAQEIQALGPDTIRAVEWNQKQVESYYEAHWPMFLSVEELTRARDALNEQIGKKRLKSIGLDLEDDDPQPAASSPFLDPKQPLPKEQVRNRFSQYDEGFLTHPDHKSLTVLVRPAGTSLGVGEARALIARLHTIVDQHQAELKAGHLRAGFGGTFPLFVAEYDGIMHDVASTALLCLSLVLGSLFLFFRDLRSTISLGIVVLMAVGVTFGLTRLVIGYLNTQTAFLGSIVVGNGINYGMIYLARVRQLRRTGTALEPAVIAGAHTAAHATLLASAASSVSFGVLVLAANRGFRHFGFIGGIGMLLCWLFTFALVPALLALFEKVRPVKPDPRATVANRPAPRWLCRLFASPQAIIAVFSVLLVVSVVLFTRQLPTAIERNLDNLTNDLKGQQELKRDNLRANEATGRSTAGAIALLPSREAADEFCSVIRERQKDPRYAPVIESCDTISSVVPNHQDEKLALIQELHDRITDKVLKAVPAEQAAKLRDVRADLELQRPVAESAAPAGLVERFRERDGSLGRLAVVTARPNAKLELAPNLQAFVDAVRGVPVAGKTYDATGENVIFADLLKNIAVEGPQTTVGSLLGVCILVVLFLRRWRMSLDVIGSLIAGVVLMGGAAAALHLKINFFNFIVFPITFGIAVDYGANVIVRIKERGGDVLGALAEVGPAVALCSWTSMIGYGSLIIALNRALQSFGWYALVGEITSIATALILLPAMSLLARTESRTAPAAIETSG